LRKARSSWSGLLGCYDGFLAGISCAVFTPREVKVSDNSFARLTAASNFPTPTNATARRFSGFAESRSFSARQNLRA
jgi:hypothetical protein